MIIPIDRLKVKYNIGDIVIITETIKLDTCYITQGHECIIVEKLKNNNQFKLKDINSDFHFSTDTKKFTIKIDHSTAISNYNKILNKKRIIKFIDEKCKNKYRGYDYEDKEFYNMCKLNKKICTPCVKCISYISNDEIKKDNFILTHLRNYKIKKIKNEL